MCYALASLALYTLITRCGREGLGQTDANNARLPCGRRPSFGAAPTPSLQRRGGAETQTRPGTLAGLP
jgi:hypothetical protein